MSKSPVSITIIASNKVLGAFTLPCEWNDIMGDVADQLEETDRISDMLESRTGLRCRFADFNYSDSTATFYV